MKTPENKEEAIAMCEALMRYCEKQSMRDNDPWIDAKKLFSYGMAHLTRWKGQP